MAGIGKTRGQVNRAGGGHNQTVAIFLQSRRSRLLIDILVAIRGHASSWRSFVYARYRDQRDLGRGKQAYRRPPSAGAAADIQTSPVGQFGETGVYTIGQPR